MSDPHTRQIVITLPVGDYDALAELAEPAAVETLVVELLDEILRYGPPGELHAAVRLANEVSDMLLHRWRKRQAALIEISAELGRLADALRRLTRER
jgi:hypothetical protein